MPNWVYNNVGVSGSAEDLRKFYDHARQPHFEAIYENHTATGELAMSEVEFSFWNFIAPPESAVLSGEYFGTHGFSKEGATGDTENNWYNFNNREWGTKWDACHIEEDDFEEGATWWGLKFETAWSIPFPVLSKMVEMFPTLNFDFHCEEEQGWGAEYEGVDGELITLEEWDIPESHADYVKRDRECYCEFDDDPENWFDDCPRPEKDIVANSPEPLTAEQLVKRFDDEFGASA